MARETSYQSVGNPLQASRLPRSRCELAFPYTPFKPSQDVRFALRVVGYLLYVATAAVLASSSIVMWGPDHFAFAIAMPLALGIIVIIKHASKLHFRSIMLLILFLIGGVAYVHLPISGVARTILAAVMLGVLVRCVAIHWTQLCVATPLDRSTARQLNRQWNHYINVMSLVPIGIVALAHGFPLIVACGASAALLLFQIFAFLCQRHRQRWSVPWRSLISWLTYDRQQACPPGTWRSPAGSWTSRIACTATCIVVITSTIASPAENPVSAHAATPILFLLLGSVGSLVVTLGIPLALCLPTLAAADAWRSGEVSADNWKPLIRSVQDSLDPIERKSLYMGRIAHDGSPLLVPRDTFGEHAHFLGDSGAGKTSLGLGPLIEQLGSSGDCSIIVIDLKADSMELLATQMATVTEVQRRHGRHVPFKFFTNQNDRCTYAYNPLQYPFWQNLDLYMRTDILCGALGLTYGPDYGQGYYSSANAAVLYHTVKTFPDVRSFGELAQRIRFVSSNAKRNELHPEVRKAGVHVQMVLDRLASFEALNVTPDAGYPAEVVNEAIDLGKSFDQPQFAYFHLSSTLAPGSSPEIARLVTYSLLAAATQGQRRCQVYLVIDEFQRMVARNIEYLLQLARSMGVGVILANQTMQDLRTSTADLIPPIEANCRYRQWFSVSSAEDRERLIKGSGETVDLLTARTYGDEKESVSFREQVTTRLMVNDVLLASDHPRQSIVRISRGDGYAQYGGMPFVLESDYHITEREYQARKLTPWPDRPTGSFLPGTVQTGSQAGAPGSSGPQVTTQVVGGASPATGSTQDPFASFNQANPPKRQGTRKR